MRFRRGLLQLTMGLVPFLTIAGLAIPQPPSTPPSDSDKSSAARPLDQPLQWLQEARQTHKSIRDYSCTLLKQERVQGRLQEQNIILVKVRTQPFSVYMRWLSPQSLAGQEVAFVYGRNSNKMRVHFTRGVKGVVGWKSVDPNDPRVFQHSRHTIYEAGIGNMIEQLIQNLERERQLDKTQVRTAEYTYNNRRCYRVEATGTERGPQTPVGRCVFFLDKESKLPIRMENYEWPQSGATEGELLEVFSFTDIRFNTGLSDSDFVR